MRGSVATSQVLRSVKCSPGSALILLHDCFMVALSFWLALGLRVGFQSLAFPSLVDEVVTFTLMAMPVFMVLETSRHVWRHTSIGTLVMVVQAATLILTLFLLATFAIDRLDEIPRSVPAIQWLLLVGLLAGPRLACRVSSERWSSHPDKGRQPPPPVLVVGTGEGASLFVRAMANRSSASHRVVGILDPSGRHVGRLLWGVPVLGSPLDLERVLRHLRLRRVAPTRLVITEPLDPSLLRRLIGEAEPQGIVVCRMPSVVEFTAALDDQRVELRPVALRELLGRPQVQLNRAIVEAAIKGRRLLITGAGGSIGSELVRQVAALQPSLVVLMDTGEYNLYAIDLELQHRFPDLPRVAALADVRDREQVFRLVETTRPDIIFHAAALKHVPLVELNPAAAAETNVLGTANVADAARALGCLAVVQVSTDKAVNPTSVMGATKRLAELYCQTLDGLNSKAVGTPAARFMTVRFGNVLGSSGSVVPLFQRQLAHGGPLTVTHPDMRRYFMTVQEAVELVLQSTAHGLEPGASRGSIAVLDMGEPIRVLDIARQIIRLAGKEPGRDVAIEFIGMRLGEKLYEELFDSGEARLPSRCPGVFSARSRQLDYEILQGHIQDIAAATTSGDPTQVRLALARAVPGYRDAPSSVAA